MSQFSTEDGHSGSDHLRQKAEDVKAQARAEGAELKARAREGLEEAKGTAVKKGEEAKNRAADEISRTAEALRTAAEQLDDGSIQHQMFTEASNAVGSVSNALANHSISEIVENLSQFGRRNPAAVIGGAVLAGLIVSRFVKASAEPTAAASGPTAPSRYAADPYAPYTKEPFNG